ncbi:hypothetical protein SASPL_101169 [Salvia splendens]|uniref:Auxin responsive GH3 protein family n=1 Tax=Salvia splendens TaxID=180675 RepID=A0A8X8YNS7_SALSN|nr:hypothetical protein SASPL_101169 [Salvia splendens]
MPHTAYLEFLPLDPDCSGSELVDLVNVEIGKEYELVVTNYNGLYRYRVGDKFCVTGFHNSTQQIRMVGLSGSWSSSAALPWRRRWMESTGGVDKSIGALEIRIVKRGSFEELMNYALEKSSAAFSQYKTPNCVKLKPMVDLLNSMVVAAHFSSSGPHWALEERL